jgi:ABC-type branched-subunit amino acid transport system substrate-binding protein
MRPTLGTIGTARRRQTFRWGLFPRSDRWPKLWRDWLPLTMAVVLVAGLLTVVGWKGPWLRDRLGCRPGLLPSSEIWSQGDECVGVTDGSYAFGLADFAGVLDKIADQNKAAGADPCGTGAPAVTVGVLMTLNSPGVGGRARHQLEGIAAGQAKANQAGCIRPIRLRTGQMGADEQAATGVARLLADDADVVAVVGMGLSHQQSANAAQLLAENRIPMVSDVITAEGFDSNGSGDDHPDYTTCDPHATYTRGVGQGFFYRVAFRNAVQIGQLGEYVKQTVDKGLDFIVTPTTTTDPYTCSTLPLLRRQFGAGVHEVRFDPADPTTVSQSAKRICATDGPVTVFYAARARDLARFLSSVQQEAGRGLCRSRAVTVLSTSDAVRLRVRETEPNLDELRVNALASPTFKDGTVRLMYTPLADPDVLGRAAGTGFAQLQKVFTGLGFDTADLDDGWAINGYDALVTVAAALNTLSAGPRVTRSQVNTAIGGFSAPGQSVAAAGGDTTFDNNGNRSDRKPVVVRLCPPTSTAHASRPITVEVYPSTNNCP